MGHGGTHLAPSLRTNAAGEAEELSTIDELHVVKVVNQILVPDHEAGLAKLALERMLDIS